MNGGLIHHGIELEEAAHSPATGFASSLLRDANTHSIRFSAVPVTLVSASNTEYYGIINAGDVRGIFTSASGNMYTGEFQGE